ncbi:hypothetical protein [Sagittula sp. S175]|uniref:hypothetical protein n=1 Tax=Sagittula sp. S175 TaxID=3415129 RepID=UPI003C7A9D93
MRLALVLPLMLCALPALAYEHTVEYRFTGAELVAFNVTEGPDEDPTVLSIGLQTDGGGVTLEIESDLGLGDCAEVLTYAQGNPGVTVVLTANLNAQTMNGVTLVQCSER